jgi:hypothetical protein
MHDPTLEDSNERDRIAGSWSSVPSVFFLVAMPLEWWLWKDAPFCNWAGKWFWAIDRGRCRALDWQRRASCRPAALRRHPARFAFVLPALALHLAIFALYGPYWRSGAGTAASPSTGWSRHCASLRRCPPCWSKRSRAPVRIHQEVLRDIALLRRLGQMNAPAPDGRYPLDAAARPEALAALLDSGARRHSDQVSAQLRRLVDADDSATLGRLLALGVDPDLVESTEPSGVTALRAARWEHVEAFDALLAAGARLDRTDRHGRTALDHAHNGGSTQFWSASRSTKVRHRRLRRRQAQANAEPQPRGCRTKGRFLHNTAGPADVGTDAHRLEPKPLRTAPPARPPALVCCLAGFLLFFS